MMEQDDACHTFHGMKEIRIVKTTGKPGKACPQSLGLREGGRRPSTGTELKEPQGLEVQGAAGSDRTLALSSWDKEGHREGREEGVASLVLSQRGSSPSSTTR